MDRVKLLKEKPCQGNSLHGKIQVQNFPKYEARVLMSTMWNSGAHRHNYKSEDRTVASLTFNPHTLWFPITAVYQFHAYDDSTWYWIEVGLCKSFFILIWTMGRMYESFNVWEGLNTSVWHEVYDRLHHHQDFSDTTPRTTVVTVLCWISPETSVFLFWLFLKEPKLSLMNFIF
jgi:hypothetical protein